MGQSQQLAFKKWVGAGLSEDSPYETVAPHKTTCKTVKTHKKRKKRLERPTFRSQVCLAVQFYCFFLNGVHYEETINRCSFIDRTKGLVSRGCAVFNGLIRDQAKLCKITAALQAGVAWEDRTQSDIYKWKVFKKTKPKNNNKITEETFSFLQNFTSTKFTNTKFNTTPILICQVHRRESHLSQVKINTDWAASSDVATWEDMWST